MENRARDIKNTTAEIDGLDDVFDVEYTPNEHGLNTVPAMFEHGANDSAVQGAGMSLKAACIHYRLAASTLRLKIKRGEIPAKKIHGANGPEWRVFLASSDFGDPNKHGADQGTNTAQPGYQGLASHDANRLLTLIEKQSAKLEAASMQIGYYKAQWEASQEHIKLLTDSQHKAGFWRKAWRWLTGSGV